MELPLLGMGTWGMGGKFEQDPSNFDESVELLRFGFDLGIMLVDVAELHGDGLTEKIVGEAIKGYPRKKLCIISKVSRDHLGHDDVLKAAEGSLARLGTDYIDFYLIHKLPPKTAFAPAETLSALERLQSDGLIKHIGVSNFSARQIEEAQRSLKNTPIEVNEIEYNLLYQREGNDILPVARKKGMRLIAHRPLARGELARGENETLSTLSRKYGKTPAQIALNFILSQDITAIPKAGSREHMQENAGVLGWKLTKEDIEALRTVDGSVSYEAIKQ